MGRSPGGRGPDPSLRRLGHPGRLDQTESVFAPDAIVDIGSPYDIHLEGSGAIRDFLNEATAGSELLVQTASSVVVRLAGADRATATSTIHELSVGSVSATTNFAAAGTAVNYESYGIYADEAIKRDGEWKLARRSFQPLYVSPDSLSGHVIAPRSILAHLSRTL